MPEAVIVDAVRTPIGRAMKGSLAPLRPDETLAYVIDQVLERNPGVDPRGVEEVIAGCGQPQGLQANNIARIAVLLSDKLGQETAGSTISRYCSSGLDAIRAAANHVAVGQGDIYVAAGVEFVSSYNGAQEATRPEDQHDRLKGGDGRPDAFITMGLTAENVAERYGITREEQDALALRSHQRASRAIASGRAREEIAPVVIPQRTGDPVVVDTDEHPRPDTSLEKLAALRPVFRPHGTVTAGNSSGINDGAAAVLLTSADAAERLGLHPLARVVASAVAGVDPAYMGLGPIPATRKVLERTGLRIEDFDVIELNEAFAAQVIPCVRELGIPMEKLNPNGGAIALGHPIGFSGARLVTTLVHELRLRQGRYGLATMCIGVGQGIAIVLERVA